jgi:hypothetical protein
MNKRLGIHLAFWLIAALLAMPSAFAQNTTSAISGRITDPAGKPVAGATVEVLHVPSGTVKSATTDADGRYSEQALRVGGPFKIIVSKSGLETTERNDVYLQLAQETSLNLVMGAAAATELGGVTVTATAASLVFQPDNKGLSTNISRRELEAAPNPDRSIQDIARLDPRISITDRDAGAISANGKNFRYNCITVDTINAGDPFGLESNGLASVGTPISPDVIDSYNLSTANFDVATRGCVGANVNAVTKSGTNDFHGSVYYSYRNADKLMGDIAPISGGPELPYTGWNREWTTGFTTGGPIIKDTLFFFLAAEQSERVAIGAVSGPVGSTSTTQVTGITQDFVNGVTSSATAQGLDVGDRTLANLVDKRYLAKIDWNINESQRAVFRYNETKENQPVPTGSTTSVTLNSNWYFKNRDTKSYIVQLFSDWNSTFSTEANLSYTDYEQARGPLTGVYQPSVTVSNSPTVFSPSVTVGTEFSSQVNALRIKSLYYYFAGTWLLGDHTVKAGFNGQEDKVFNAFVQGYNGSYTYQGLANFQAGNWEEYLVKQAAPGFTLDSAAARFKKGQYGVFLEDTWQATERLSVQYGLRYDVPKFPSDPILNPCFASAPGVPFTAPGVCTASKGGFGYANNSTPSSGSIQPRLGFNYNFDTERMTQLRGGVGMFTSDVPTVWYSNSYGGSGIPIVTYDIVNAANSPVGTLLCSSNGRTFTPATGASCPAGQVSYIKQAPGYTGNPVIPSTGTLVLGSGVAKMGVDTIDPNFQMPTTTQVALAFDRELPWWNLIGTVEGSYVKTNDDIFYKNLNLGAPTGHGPDGRNLYWGTYSTAGIASGTVANANPSFGNVTELSNTHQGQSSSLTLLVKKPMSDDWSASIAAVFQHSTDVNPGTSSVANSNILGNVWVNPNTDKAAVSNYNVPEALKISATWQHKFFGDNETSVSMFANGHSGAPYSWIAGNDLNGDTYSRDLIYIPKSVTDVVWAPAVTEAQKQQFMDYIASDSYLSKHEGQIAGRNGANTAWLNQIDMSFSQQVPGIFGDAKGEFRLDIFNFGNLLNSKWGVERRGPFPLTRNLANVVGIDPATGKYIYDISNAAYKNPQGNYAPQSLVINEGQTPGVPVPSQRWSIMLTARYSF